MKHSNERNVPWLLVALGIVPRPPKPILIIGAPELPEKKLRRKLGRNMREYHIIFHALGFGQTCTFQLLYPGKHVTDVSLDELKNMVEQESKAA